MNEDRYKLAYRRGYNAGRTLTAQAQPDSDPLRLMALQLVHVLQELGVVADLLEAGDQQFHGLNRGERV